MSKKHKQAGRNAPRQGARSGGGAWIIIVVVLAAGGALAWHFGNRGKTADGAKPSGGGASNSVAAVAMTALPTNEVAQAVMVTVELDFGGPPPGIAEALAQVERRHEPEDRVGRTFAILDAYGGPTPSGKLHMSMHVSMEKPGLGSLVFKRTGEELWKSRIVPRKEGPPGPKNLTVIMDDKATGKSMMLDGSRGIGKVLDVPLHNTSNVVRDLWPDGADREFTYIYSACGCPVKAMVRRIGEMTTRTTNSPVMFPDDPEALALIHSLMGWPPPGR
jgi:hypothetical protein